MKIADLTIEVDEDGSRIVKDEIGGLRTGQRVRVLEDADESGPYAGTYADDEGELQIEVVGSPQYGNERVSFGIKTEHHDEFIDVEADNVEIVDA